MLAASLGVTLSGLFKTLRSNARAARPVRKAEQAGRRCIYFAALLEALAFDSISKVRVVLFTASR